MRGVGDGISGVVRKVGGYRSVQGTRRSGKLKLEDEGDKLRSKNNMKVKCKSFLPETDRANYR